MRIMYFAFEGFDNPNGTNHLALKMIDYLLNEGIEVYLLSSHTRGIDPDIPPLLQSRKGLTFDIVNRSVVDKQNFVMRYLEGIKYALSCMKKWRKQKRTLDAVILQSTPTAFFSSILMKLFLRKPVIFNSYDVFPNVAYETGALTNNVIYKVLLAMQKLVYKFSDQIIVISSDMRHTLMAQGVEEGKITEIRNWYDQETVHEVEPESNRFRQKYDIPQDCFWVQYAGNFGFTFDYKYVLDVAERLQDEQHVRFQMIGDGAFQKEFMSEAKQRGLENITFFPWQPIDIISDVYSSCDVSLIPLANGVINNSFPSKGSLLMACGKVVLCATEESSDYYRMINENEVGICVSNKDANQAADAIRRLFNDKEYHAKLADNAKIFGQKCYSSNYNLPKFLKVLGRYQ